MKPDPELLREIGLNSTNVETSWAGAADDLARGLNFWTRAQIGRDRAIAVRAALNACKLVIADYSGEQEGLPPRAYVDDMSQLIERWLDNPSKDNMELVRSALDVTRSAHAWQRDKDVEASWILEAVDHASLAVWAGDRSSYIIPLDFATCAARAVACVLHAMLDAKVPEDKAVSDIVEAITISTV